MEVVTWTSMFLLGLLGTGHCVGMCGPLVCAIPGRESSVLPHFLYHLGRANTYMLIGGVLGGIGQVLKSGSAAALQTTVWIQAVMTGFSCAFLLWFGISKLGILETPRWMKIATPEMIPGFSSFQKELLTLRGFISYYLLGLLFGFLPCGLSYAAFAVALNAGLAWEGAALVGVFALGTMPGLLAVGFFASNILKKYSELSDLIAGLIMIGISVYQAMKLIQILF